SGLIPSQGVSEASEFIDCLGTIVIEKEPKKFEPTYHIVIRNYKKRDGWSMEPGYIVGVSDIKKIRYPKITYMPILIGGTTYFLISLRTIWQDGHRGLSKMVQFYTLSMDSRMANLLISN